MTVYIYSASANTWPADPKAPELKTTVKELWGKSYRRLSHFIELAMVGAKRCVDKAPAAIEPQCKVLFTTGQGNISQVAKVTRQIFKDLQPPMPFDFMHITNNMAPFYVAQALQLNSSNLTVAHRAFAFESAVDLATLNLATAKGQYLIGAVDECAYPLTEHRRRLGLSQDTQLAEGSHWLLVGSEPQHAIARLELCRFYPSRNTLLAYLSRQPPPDSLVLAFGHRIDAAERQLLMQDLDVVEVYDYAAQTGYHDTAAAYAVTSFIESHSQQTLLYINKSPQLRYSAVSIRVY